MSESPEQVPSEDGNSFLEDELEALSSIYMNETNVSKTDEATVISIDLHPATADNLEEQYVKLTLKLTVKDRYPDVIPEIDIRNPRGLSDEKLSSITKDLLKIAEDKRGNSMLFQIIEAAKDYLTAGNRPCEECAICLYGFHEDDVFTKTECYHYFHSSCLARYAKTSPASEDDNKSDESSKNELLCPVCRLPINFDGVEDSYPSPLKGDDEFSVTDTILQTQKRLQELYIKQVEKGGIIDLEAEKNKYLIEISNVPSVLDAAPEARSDEETGLKLPQEKDNALPTSPSEKSKNDKLDSHKYSPNRSSHSERPDRRYTKHNEERRFNSGPRPYYGNGYRNDRYQSNRGNGDYRRDTRGGRGNYNRRYNNYGNDRTDRFNRDRFNNPRRDNWHENKHDDRSSQRYERNDRVENRKRYDRHDDGRQRCDSSRSQELSQTRSQEVQEGVLCKDSEDRSQEFEQKSDNEDNQERPVDRESNGKVGDRYDGRRNVRYSRGHRNNQYNDRRENNYDRRNGRYDYNKKYRTFNDYGQYDRKYEHNESGRSENFVPRRNNTTKEMNRNRHLYQADEDKEFKEEKSDAKNVSPVERESKISNTSLEIKKERNSIERDCHNEPDENIRISSKDEVEHEDDDDTSKNQHEAKSNYNPYRKNNYPKRNSDNRRLNDNRSYNRHYQRSNSNGDRYNGYSGRYPKQSNYHSERRQPKPQNFRRNSDDLNEGESENALNSDEAIAKEVGESQKSTFDDHQELNDEESGDFPENQHSRKSSVRTDTGYKSYRDGKQGYGNRYQNNNTNYHETRPYRNNPRSRNSHSNYSERTSNGSKRYIHQKYTSDSSHDIPLTDNDTDVKQEAEVKESVKPASVKISGNKPTQVPPKDSELEKSVPTSNFLPSMSSVAPPPGFQNPSRKIVYGLAAANPPPGFNRS